MNLNISRQTLFACSSKESDSSLVITTVFTHKAKVLINPFLPCFQHFNQLEREITGREPPCPDSRVTVECFLWFRDARP